jgi:hypothetical protein
MSEQKPWACWRCNQLNSWWANECGRCQAPMKKPVNELNVVVDELRDRVVKLIELLRAVPAERRTPAQERMLHELQHAVEQYDRSAER